MDQKLFTEVYEDKPFKRQIEKQLQSLFNKNKIYFNNSVIDFEDFTQEIWCQLFEEPMFLPDRAWCAESMIKNALNYCRDMKRRQEIAPMDMLHESA